MNYFPVKPGNQLIYDMINDRFGTSYTLGQLTLGPPTPTVSEGRNTEVTVGVTTGPLVNQITKALYNRLNLSILFDNYDKNIVDSGSFTNVSDVLSYIQSNFNVLIQPGDIVDAAIGTGPYPRAFTIQAAPGSYSYLGNVVFNLTQPAVQPPAWTVARYDNVDMGGFLSIESSGDLVNNYDGLPFVQIEAEGPEQEQINIGFRYIRQSGEGNIDTFQTLDGGAGPYFPLQFADLTTWGFDFLIYVNNAGSTSYDLLNKYQPAIVFSSTAAGVSPFRIRLQEIGGVFRWVDDSDNVVVVNPSFGDSWTFREGNFFGFSRVTFNNDLAGPGGILSLMDITTLDFNLNAEIQLIDRTDQAIEFSEDILAELSDPGTGGEGSGPNAWTVFKVDNSIFGNTTDTGTGGDLYMMPNGETVDGDAFSRIETHDQRSVPAPFGRYVSGVRFSTTPVPENPVQATSSGGSTPSVYNLTLAAVDTPWAIDITVNNDFNLTQADPFNGTLNGFEYGIVINPDGLGIFPMRAVMVDNAGTKTIEIRQAVTNALVKVADHVMFGAPGTLQEGNIVGFQVRFPHELLLSWFPAVEKTSADVPYGFWNCRIEFFATGQWDLPPFTIPFFDTQANIAAP